MGESRFIKYLKIFINLLFAVIVVLCLVIIVPKLLGFFLPFVIGWIVAMIANPLVKFLESKVKLLRKHSSAIIIIVVIAAIVGTLYLIVSVLIKESKQLAKDLPAIIEQVEVQIDNISVKIRDINNDMPKPVQKFVDNLLDRINKNLMNFEPSGDLLTFSGASNLAQNIAEFFLTFIITILSAYFFIIKRDELMEGFKKFFPNSVIEGWNLIYNNFTKAVGGYFKAQLKIMFVLTIIMIVGFEILKVSYSVLLALGIAFLDFLPVFGTGAVLWPWALVDMLSGNYFRAIGLVIIYLICQITKQVLQPKMVGDSIGLSPLSTLIFLYIGYKLYGVLGMILGVPVGMVIVNLYRVGTFDRLIRGFKIIIHDINEFRKF
ncbi:sporulation integral membrane protein YtvI [Herbinix hemicellulosilytica]|uniref:Putative membrane protein n=1 Tax=Herbinix hemicellulosilytica TaxID=1564487 RepID=A0A0H5SD72_HERHM|nr:sporulation integral membrane protein YtvI [Herbinix hemicellulosilytica]RBP56938.1 sporulation integral membrane protein YtvI [Herbinix hemicellulosilytica]CRZ33374.1 putative membrane protein [Herbinix hemicellulosilytica]